VDSSTIQSMEHGRFWLRHPKPSGTALPWLSEKIITPAWVYADEAYEQKEMETKVCPKGFGAVFEKE